MRFMDIIPDGIIIELHGFQYELLLDHDGNISINDVEGHELVMDEISNVWLEIRWAIQEYF